MSSSPKRRILLVEDEAIVALGEQFALEGLGYEVSTAASGEAALRAFEGDPGFDLVLMDIDLGPGMDGPEAAERILGMRELPVVFCSSHTEPEVVEKTERITSYGYIVKGSNYAAYDASIKMALRLFEANRRLRAGEAREATANKMFQAVLDANPQYICWKDRGSAFLGCNANHAGLFGLPDTASIAGKSDWDLHRGDSAGIQKFIDDDRAVMEADAPRYRIVEKAAYPDGSRRWLETNKVPLHDAEGRVYGIMVAYSDITERKRIEDELAYERALLGALMDGSSDNIYFKDRESRFIRCSRSLASSLGLPGPEEMVGHTDFDYFRREHAEEAFADEAEVMRAGLPIRKEERDMPMGRPDAWVLVEKMPLRDDSGSIVGTFGITRDISARKLAEERIRGLLEEKELLLHEVHHRMKNTLGSVAGLLSLYASRMERPEAAEALKDAAGRVLGMAVLYEKLHRSSDFDRARFKEYAAAIVDQAVAVQSRGRAIAVEYAIGDFTLPVPVLQPLGIILNELATNSAKYAFEGRSGGLVRVAAALGPERLELSFEDDGSGMPEGAGSASSAGFGLTLVESLARQLGGSMRIVRGRGTRIEIEAPSPEGRL
jgi:PAS domain S-box-containing protein